MIGRFGAIVRDAAVAQARIPPVRGGAILVVVVLSRGGIDRGSLVDGRRIRVAREPLPRGPPLRPDHYGKWSGVTEMARHRLRAVVPRPSTQRLPPAFENVRVAVPTPWRRRAGRTGRGKGAGSPVERQLYAGRGRGGVFGPVNREPHRRAHGLGNSGPKMIRPGAGGHSQSRLDSRSCHQNLECRQGQRAECESAVATARTLTNDRRRLVIPSAVRKRAPSFASTPRGGATPTLRTNPAGSRKIEAGTVVGSARPRSYGGSF